ncbi:hypothetical protein BGW80DRAFT_1277725, partial [Lactifluus volemus]
MFKSKFLAAGLEWWWGLQGCRKGSVADSQGERWDSSGGSNSSEGRWQAPHGVGGKNPGNDGTSHWCQTLGRPRQRCPNNC